MSKANYTRFDRHDHMSSETRNEILSIKRELSRTDIKHDTDRLENWMFGLFDGYLYNNLILEAQKLPVDLYTRVSDVYFICKDYPEVVYNA
tara:strand:+ start:565 stop:837 length:273 start_codon:yes stop_codon:yes gene_type:complete